MRPYARSSRHRRAGRLHRRLDPLQRLGEVLLGVGVGEAQVALAVLAEGGAGERGDAVLVQQVVGERVCSSCPVPVMFGKT